MARTVGIGIQDFETVISGDYFYVDKTAFIREWWESGDSATLITRPRRFGKTLTMSMAEQFFSVKYAGRGDLFKNLSIWQEEKYRALQGTYPVISLSFANVKESDYFNTRKKICQMLADLYADHAFLLESKALKEKDKEFFRQISADMDDVYAGLAIHHLSKYLARYYGKKVIILLDEYDTPMQEAYVAGYWEELVSFTRSLFNAAFKTNPWMERAIMTGITRISRESIFSDLNNLKVVTTTSDEYGDAFGFTEEEVFSALEEYGMGGQKQDVKRWYDGFIFGRWKDIYNPWSILNFLDTGKFNTYWANTSSNSLVGKLIREGSRGVKESFELLMQGGHLFVPIDEQIVYNQLDGNEYAIWSLLVASGYLKVLSYEKYGAEELLTAPKYELELTNYEVRLMFRNMIRGWFAGNVSDYNDFVKALLLNDLDAMNEYMNRIASEIFSCFDTGKRVSGKAQPERFYHGFVLGLMVELEDRYVITSNRESGFGRYDIMLEPKKSGMDAFVIEFKVYNPKRDTALEDTAKAALAQIEERQYETHIRKRGLLMREYLLRNMLYVPAYQEKYIEKSLLAKADAFIYDLEDSVPEQYKKDARETLARYIKTGVFKKRVVFVRLNSLESSMLLEDLNHVLHGDITGFLISKINTAADIVYYDKLITGLETKNGLEAGHFKLVPLIETTSAVLNVYDICTASKRIIAVCFGGEDFLNDLEGVHNTPPRSLDYPRAAIATAAHAAGVQPVDTPYLAIYDEEGFIKEETLSYEMGFSGVQILSPRQIPFANTCFTPAPEEVKRSEEIVEICRNSAMEGSGVAMYNGKMIGPPIKKRAEKILEIMELIKRNEEKLS